MLGTWLSPLAPAAGLLLSAFLLFAVFPVLPKNWRTRLGLGAPVLVGLCMLTVLFVPVSVGVDALSQGLTLLSGWNFSTTESVAAFTARVDVIGLPFLLVTFLILLALTLLTADMQPTSQPKTVPTRVLGWLLMGTAGCVLFVAANGLTILYAVVAFDIVAALHFVSNGRRDTAIGRLFLGVFTGASLLTVSFAGGGWLPAQYMLGAVLWLRLALFPLTEYAAKKKRPDADRLIYLALTQLVGLYLVARLVQQPLPPAILWLTAISMLLGGLSTWLSDTLDAEATPARLREVRTRLVTKMGLTLGLLPLLVAPLSVLAATAFAVGLTLSIAVLWATPALGRPKLAEGAWSWPYLPVIMSTLTLVGVPFSLGWTYRDFSYQVVLGAESMPLVLVIAAAEALALSGLVLCWRWLLQTQEQSFRRSVVGILAMVPFLTPGLGPFILFTIIGFDPFPPLNLQSGTLALLVGPVVLAVLLGYYQAPLASRLSFLPASMRDLVFENPLLKWVEAASYVISRFVLRIQLVIEGQHYIGWAIFAALVGAIIIFLS